MAGLFLKKDATHAMPVFSVWADMQIIISPNSLDFIYQQTHELDIIWKKKLQLSPGLV